MSDPRNVVYLTGEDGLADTLRPRLDAMGADSSHVYVLQGFLTHDQETGEATEHQVSMQDLNVLDQVLTKYKPLLLVIYPMQAYLGSNVDMHRANDVRPVLAGVARLAEKHGCAIVMIRHLGKSQADRAIYRGLGSIDFTAAARSVLLAGQDPQNPSSRAVIQTKNSLAPLGPAIGYEISNDGQFSWTGVSDLTAGQVLQADKYNETGSKLEEAKDFLKDYLADGPQPTNEVLKKAENAGMNIVTIRRAKGDLHIDSYKEPGRNGRWFYRLPQNEGDHEDEEIGTSLYSLNDHLITLPGTIAGQGIGEDDQQNGMITLPEPLQNKGLGLQNKDDQQNTLMEPLENQADDQLNLMEVRI